MRRHTLNPIKAPLSNLLKLALISSVALADAVLVAPPGTAYASAGSDAIAPGTPEAIATQAPYVAAADSIRSLATSDHLVGFAGTEIRLDARTLILYWSGPVPPQLAALLQNANATVSVTVLPSTFDLAQLDTEARRAISFTKGQIGAKVTEAGPTADYSGIDLVVDRNSLGPLTLDGVQSRVNGLEDGVPITVSLGDPIVPATCPYSCSLGRWQDSEPFYGGAQINSGNQSEVCSDSWVVINKGTGYAGIMTDMHCTLSPGSTSFTTGFSPELNLGTAGVCCTGQWDNTVVSRSHAFSADEYAPRIYLGTWDSASSEPVIGQAYASRLETVCLGGAITGATCSNTVQDINRYTTTDYGYVGPGDWTTGPSGTEGAGKGDSGGPYYVDSGGQVTALGLIDAGDLGTTVPCTGYPGTWVVNRICFNRMFNMEIGPELNAEASSLMTTTWTAPCCPVGDTLSPNQTLYPSQSLNSSGANKFAAVIQGSDGNFVLYSANRALWYNGIQNHGGAWLVMQGSDGNLCEYISAGAIWCSNTGIPAHPNARLVMQGDGNLVIYDANNNAIWWTNTQHIN